MNVEGLILQVAVLAAFIPLIMSSGGNSGSQATTLVIRSLALREVRLTDWVRVLRRELLVGLSLGLVLGAIAVGRVVLLFDGDGAGLRAAWKSAGVFLGEGLEVRVVALPGGRELTIRLYAKPRFTPVTSPPLMASWKKPNCACSKKCATSSRSTGWGASMWTSGPRRSRPGTFAAARRFASGR